VTLGSIAAYAAMLLGAIAVFLLIRSYGEALGAPSLVIQSGSPAAAEPAATANPIFHVLLAMAAVIVAGRALGNLFTAIRQPPVIGEVLAGILLGPSLLGRIAPAASAYILPDHVAPLLNVVAQLGVILYMFIVGLELNVDRLRHRARATILTSHASIIAPFVLGSILALYLYPRLATADVPFTSFALFMGVAMSITAFPVLARILADRRMTETELGVVALTCAAVDDVTAWCLLAFVVGVAEAKLHGAAVVALLTAGFMALMFLAIRPVIVRFDERDRRRYPGARAVPWRTHLKGSRDDEGARDAAGDVDSEVIALALAGVLLSALTTELIGVHAIFGAFLFGAVIPHDSRLARTLTGKLKDLVTILLLPAFFAFAGMRTRIDLVSSSSEWLMCILITGVATVGKFGGSLVAARLTGMSLRDAAALGILMNTRGLMELIVLNIGLDLGVISPTLFTMMVLMALGTTMATTPLLEVLLGNRRASELTPHRASNLTSQRDDD
jgi:Kef-type K+ transport system membrane component KefB